MSSRVSSPSSLKTTAVLLQEAASIVRGVAPSLAPERAKGSLAAAPVVDVLEAARCARKVPPLRRRPETPKPIAASDRATRSRQATHLVEAL
jgi:hypothetical protein